MKIFFLPIRNLIFGRSGMASDTIAAAIQTQDPQADGDAAQSPAGDASTHDVLLHLLSESKRQTRHLRAIRWMLAIAWLVTLLGGLRLAFQ